MKMEMTGHVIVPGGNCSVPGFKAASAAAAPAVAASHAVAVFMYAIRSARSSGFFNPANTILVPASEAHHYASASGYHE